MRLNYFPNASSDFTLFLLTVLILVNGDVLARRKSWWLCAYHLYVRRTASYLFLWGFALSGARARTQQPSSPKSPRGFGGASTPGVNHRKRKRQKKEGVAVSTRQETLARRETLCPVNGVTGLPWRRNPIEAVPTTAPRPLESPFILEKHYKKRRGTSHRCVATRCHLHPPMRCLCAVGPLLRARVSSFVPLL